ncbi:MAG: FdtA/QdtA family cupin domain-containing protein [Flavobacteriaceae bacterium]|nr:FdtA/QdtA family cupin domain-containing protein [Flavobacteriaceae bacterium]
MLYQLIDIPKIKDPRGNLAVIEKTTVPFSINRVYYLFDVPTGASRGGHAHIAQAEMLVALSGSFDVILKTPSETKTIHLNRPDVGLLIPNGVWRELENFSSGAVCLVVASDVFDESDYIRNFDAYCLFKNAVAKP